MIRRSKKTLSVREFAEAYKMSAWHTCDGYVISWYDPEAIIETDEISHALN